MKKFKYFDTHCDTLTLLYSKGMNLDCDECMVSLKNISAYDGYVQFFAVFNNGSMSKRDMLAHFDYLRHQCRIFDGNIGFAVNSHDISDNILRGIASAMLSIEGVGNQPDFDLGSIEEFADAGVRMMSLCWNGDNILCGGIGENSNGITPLGARVISLMERKQIMLDVSHMSDKSFYEAFEHYALPVVASHSNSRSVTPNARNLTDEQFGLIVKSGGVCGINFYPPFMGNEGITDAIRHIEHFMSIGGEDNICIGSDFDGIDITCPGLDDSSCVASLFDELLRLNYKDSTISKIAFGNFYNLLTKFEF